MPAFQPYWGKPAVRNDRGDGWKRRHHSKPVTRHCPTRLRGALGNRRPYRDSTLRPERWLGRTEFYSQDYTRALVWMTAMAVFN
jgi:hypothetical protein